MFRLFFFFQILTQFSIIWRWGNNVVVVSVTLSVWISDLTWIPTLSIATFFVVQSHYVMARLIVPICAYVSAVYILLCQNFWLRIHRVILTLLGSFSSFWTRYRVLSLWDWLLYDVCVFILVVLFLLSSQPCPAKVAVPCPAAFAPGKSRLVACFYTVWLKDVLVDLG